MKPAILVVDDMSIFREPIEALLRQEGYRTSGAANGRDAMALMHTNAPDLVLLDLRMPVMDGLLTLSQMRANPNLAGIPVIVLSEGSDRSSIREAASLGISGYVLKSQFSADNLLSRVAHHLTARTQSDRLETSHSAPPAGEATPEAVATNRVDSPKVSTAEPGAPTIALDQVAALKSLQAIMSADVVLKQIAGFSELKGLSPTVSQILKLTSHASCTAEALGRAINQDPAVALKVLKLANSPVYSRGDTVDSVQRAVVRIGIQGIRQTVLNLGVIERFANPQIDSILSMPQFWEHSIATGIIAAELAHALSPNGADAAFTTGLLHDVGRVVFAEKFSEQYASVLTTARDLALPLEQVETRMLSLTHADVMEALLRTWNFPKHLVRPIMLHHMSVGGIRSGAPNQVTESLILALANRLAHALLLGCSGNDAIYPTEDLCAALGVGPGVISHLETAASQKTDELKFAMLAHSSASNWPRYVDQVRAQLRVPFRPLYIGQQPGIDAFRIFCGTIASASDDGDGPNMAVMHCPRFTDQASLVTKLAAAEKAANVERLPLLLLSQPGQMRVDPSLSSERPCRCLATPFVVSRFVSAVNQALEVV